MRLIYWYLRIALFLGFKEYVYTLADRWSAIPKNCWRVEVAWDIQKNLLDRGYFECSSCFWAMKTRDEHIATGKGYCYEQTLPYPASMLHGQDGVEAFEQMPDSFSQFHRNAPR